MFVLSTVHVRSSSVNCATRRIYVSYFYFYFFCDIVCRVYEYSTCVSGSDIYLKRTVVDREMNDVTKL